jgi:hypothetical protein
LGGWRVGKTENMQGRILWSTFFFETVKYEKKYTHTSACILRGTFRARSMSSDGRFTTGSRRSPPVFGESFTRLEDDGEDDDDNDSTSRDDDDDDSEDDDSEDDDDDSEDDNDDVFVLPSRRFDEVILM